MAYIESVIIRDTGGTEADVTAANALKVDGSAVTQPVNIVAGSVSASVDLQQDVFGQLVIANRYNQFEINYDTTDPDSISEITVTKTSGGDASNLNGQAVFTSNANTNGGVKAVTNLSTTYRPNSETYAAFSAIWPSGGLANSYQRIGIYDANNGFFIGYEGTAFGITLRKATVDTFTPKASWNVDTLTGAVGSKYTRNGVPEAIDFTKDNLFRVRYGWLGAAPIYWEVLSPDGEWVLFDIYRHPNTTGGTTINNPDLPMTLDIKKTAAGATVLTMNTACWAAGTTSPYTKISSTITDNTLANMSRSVITGRSSTGGGTYYNVKVNPSGSLVTTNDANYAEDSAHASGDIGTSILAVRNDTNAVITSNDGDYSQISVNDKGAVAINDGGNSITVDGSVTASVSGTVTATVDFSYKEDQAHTSGDNGAFILGVRNDGAATGFTSTNGDYSPIATDRAGRIFDYASQETGTPYLRGVSTIGGVDANTGNAEVDNIYVLTNGNALAVGLADKNGDLLPAEKLIETHRKEDDPHTTGDYGNFVLAVRNDANAVVTSTDGDYSQISVNDKGAIAIQDGGNSITVDGTVGVSGTVTVSGTVAATQSGTWVLGANSGVDIGDVTVNNAGGASAVNIQDGGNSITVDGTVAFSNTTIAVTQATAASLNATVVQGTATNLKTQAENYQGGTAVGAANPLQVSLANTGANATAVKVDGSAVTQPVSGTVAFSNTTIAVTNAGTFAVQAAQSGTWILGANSGVDIGDVTINNAGGASAVNIQDGGNSITVDGTVAATQSGTWILGANSGVDIGDVTINNGTGVNAVNIQDGGNSITVDGTVAATQSGTWILGANSGVDIGDVTINNASGASAVNIQDGGNSITVDGTVTANAGTGNFTVVQATASNLNATIGNAAGASAVNIQDGGNSITVDGTVSVTPPTLTKGTQGATGFSTQDLKDAGRTAVRYYAVAAAAGATTTETAITLTRSSGTSATSTAVSWTPTSGKTFRIQAISFATRGNATATAQTTTFNFRINTAGAVTTTSTPIILAMRSATPATANAWDRILLEIPDGIEIAGDGTLQFGITAAATYTTNAPTWDVTIVGYEY